MTTYRYVILNVGKMKREGEKDSPTKYGGAVTGGRGGCGATSSLAE